MKLLIISLFAAVAFAAPEADPSILLGSGLGYSTLGLPLASRTILGSRIIGSPLIGRTLVGSPLLRTLWKREAEADPEADPSILLNSGLGLVNPLGLGYAGLAAAPLTTVAAPSTLSIATRTPLIGSTLVGSPLLRTLWKREAEAEPEADPTLVTLNSGLVNPLGLGLAGLPIARSVIAPRVITAAPAANIIASRTLIGSPLLRTLWKREAEAEPEADPTLLLNSGLVSPLGLGYAGIAGVPLARSIVSPSVITAAPAANIIASRSLIGSPLLRTLWKREAEAEPEADPTLLLNSGIAGVPLLNSGIAGVPLLRSSAIVSNPLLASRAILPAVTPAATAPLLRAAPLLRSGLWW